jgi:hypothetical protein
MKYHVTNTDNPIDFPVTKFVHIVQVHPVENGEPNLYKVKREDEFEEKWRANNFLEWANAHYKARNLPLKAVYYGCVNDATGELV